MNTSKIRRCQWSDGVVGDVSLRPFTERPFAKTAGRNTDSYLKRIKDLPLVVSFFWLRDNLLKDTKREIRIRVNLGINKLLDTELEFTKKRVAWSRVVDEYNCV